MSPTLLIDLDDTLLENDIGVFVPAYLQVLSTELKAYADPQKLVSTLLSAIHQMVLNRRPDCTLKDVFDAAFFPELGLDMSELRETIDKFYAEVFPGLKRLTQPIPGAVQLVEQALERGFQIAIATNPLFPQTAILQRLAWAGLPPEKYPFQLVASYETLHFSKPHPAYFAEILARLGWPEGAVVSIGNDLQNDIVPSRQLGLQTFWVNRAGSPAPTSPHDSTSSGSLADIIPWLDQMPAESLQPDFATPAAFMAVLRSTPAVLDTLARELPGNVWTERPHSNEWSITEILCHLRDVEAEVNLPRLQKVLQDANPFLPGKDTDPWAEERQYICQSGAQAFGKFLARRMELLDMLEALPAEDWQRPARHAIFGPTHLGELVSIIAGHDRLHIQQVCQDLNSLPHSAPTR